MVQKKYGGLLGFLLIVNFIGLMFEIDLTATYLFLGFMMFLLSLSMYIYLNFKVNNLSKQEDASPETLSTLNSVLATTPTSMVSTVLPYAVVTAINLVLKAAAF